MNIYRDKYSNKSAKPKHTLVIASEDNKVDAAN
jgi:hypothetical protein